MKFIGIKRTFSTENDAQYQTIGAFWDETSAAYGREKLMGLGFGWTGNSIEYAIALKNGIIPDADFEIDLPDSWTTVEGKTKDLGLIYEKIYQGGALLYEIEEFDDEGICRIRYCR